MLEKNKTPGLSALATFTTGMEGSTDIQYAQIVADHIGSKHTVVTFTE